jgi:hypothetical protein
MIPKGKLLALLLAFTAVGGLAATGAFTTVQAERTADVSVDGDANALLAIEPIPDPANSDFVTQSDTEDQTFEIDLDNAVNARASTTAEDLINITNNGEEPVDLWIATQGGAQEDNSTVNTTFYISSDNIENDGNSLDAQEVAPTDSANFGARALAQDIDTHQAFVDGDTSLSENDVGDTDVVISEVEADSSEDQTPGKASPVTLAPGDSIRVSFAVEIDGEPEFIDQDDGSSEDPTPILQDVVIFAVNDDEDGSTTVDQDLATSPGNETAV